MQRSFRLFLILRLSRQLNVYSTGSLSLSELRRRHAIKACSGNGPPSKVGSGPYAHAVPVHLPSIRGVFIFCRTY